MKEIIIKESELNENGEINITLTFERDIVEPPIVEPPKPQPPQPKPPTQEGERRVYDEDLAEERVQSTPTNPVYPLGISSVLDIEYQGSFRVTADWGERGESTSSYAVGRLGLNKANNSLFLAGHDHDDAIAEFKIPESFSFASWAGNIVNADVIQEYEKLLDEDPDGRPNDRICGLLVVDDKLLVTSEIWYDGGANNDDALQILNANNLKDSDKATFYRVNGDAKIAGYMSEIPEDAQTLLGGQYLIGWASNASITSRYSQGASLAVFDPSNIVDGVLQNNIKMMYPYSINDQSKQLTPHGHKTADDNPHPMWNTLSRAVYAFIVPDTKILVVVGSSGGNHNGILYKTDQRYPDRKCNGSCPIKAGDSYNYFWLYDLNEIVNAENVWAARPFSYGKWSHPHDDGGANVRGATYDKEKGLLYVSLYGKGQTGRYDVVPLINVYKVTAKK